MESSTCRSGFNRDKVLGPLPDGPMNGSFSQMLVAMFSPLLGDLLSLCLPKEKVSKEKGHPASLSSANRRRFPARDASCAGAAELASLKQSSRNSRTARVVLGSAEGIVVCATLEIGENACLKHPTNLS
jgi:hypothetical protein